MYGLLAKSPKRPFFIKHDEGKTRLMSVQFLCVRPPKKRSHVWFKVVCALRLKSHEHIVESDSSAGG
jgi:hypothetical protein